jgi:hypothetical protein
MDEENVVFIYNGIIFKHLSLAGKWMELENIT